jgi:uncharacterized surface protein with fasciclin (FAS1) repeats
MMSRIYPLLADNLLNNINNCRYKSFRMRFTNKFFLIVVFALVLTACKKWDDHVAVTNQDLSQNLSQAITSNSGLSTFAQYLKQTGVDSLLTSSKNFTVWAPTNAALQNLDPAIVNDPARLRSFVLNHISNQSYFTRDAQATLRVQMLNGKFNAFTGTKFDEANLSSPDKFVSNGVLHTIDKAIVVLPSIWEFINSTATQYTQNSYIAGLNFTDFDPSLAIVDSISASTGQPVYKPGTGVVTRNRFNERVYDLRKEDRQYTYFIIQDAGFKLESDSLLKYYATGNTTSTDSLAKWNTVKDLVVEGAYPATALTGLVSRFGVLLPVNPAFIVETRKLSNGIVHVLSRLDVPNASKIREIRVEGENPSGFSRNDKRGNTNYRVKLDTAGQIFNDLMVSGHAVSGFYAFYRLNEMPAARYKVIARAVNDFQAAAFSQNIVITYLTPPSTYTTLATLPFAVPLSTALGAYLERDLGFVTVTNYGTVEVQLTASGTNPIVLDYLRLVPEL